MKKIIFLLGVFLTSSMISQTITYPKASLLKKKQIFSTRVSWVSNINYFALDTINDPGSNYWIDASNFNIGGIQPQNGEYLLQNSVGLVLKPTWTELYNNYTDYIDSSYTDQRQIQIRGSIIAATQTLSINSNSLSISSGNTVVVPSSTLTAITASTGIGIISGSVVTNTAPDKTVTLSGLGLNVTSAYPSFTISIPTRTMSTPTRSLNASYTISAISDYNVNYSVYAQVTSILAGTNTADVYLEISPNNSSWTTISRSGISVGGVVSTSGNTQTIGGFIPAGYYIRIRTSATGLNSGSAVFTYQNGQENSY